jgi:hypothetical protein
MAGIKELHVIDAEYSSFKDATPPTEKEQARGCSLTLVIEKCGFKSIVTIVSCLWISNANCWPAYGESRAIRPPRIVLSVPTY